MPAEGIHLTALREASASQRLAPEARRVLVRHEDAGRMGAVLPDLPYFHRYAEEVARYALGIPARASAWGASVHDGAAVSILGALVALAREERSPELAALALGVGSHCAIDRAMHPLINALARRHAGGLTHDAAHREVEKFQSICFHEEYFGQDRMGTHGIVRLCAVPMRELFAKPHVARAVTGAYAASMPDAPASAMLAAMGRGYQQHVLLIGSPLGRRIATAAEKRDARPRFLHGSWGTFAEVLSWAIARSLDVIERVWAAYDADERDASALRAELQRALPAGTIDGQGVDVDLAQPYAPQDMQQDPLRDRVN